MGIKVPAGECNIEFNYVTPGLKAGVVCTVGAAFIIVIYYIVLKKVFRYKPNPNVHLYEQQQLDTVINHNAYIRTIEKRLTNSLKAMNCPREITAVMKATKMRIYPMMIQQNKPQKRGQYAFI